MQRMFYQPPSVKCELINTIKNFTKTIYISEFIFHRLRPPPPPKPPPPENPPPEPEPDEYVEDIEELIDELIA